MNFLQVSAGGHAFGIDVAEIEDVVAALPVLPVPRVRPCIAGVVGLRGNIITIVDLAACLGLKATECKKMHVVTRHEGLLYGLGVDEAQEVIDIGPEDMQPLPANGASAWLGAVKGVLQCEKLVFVLDAQRLVAGICTREEVNA